MASPDDSVLTCLTDESKPLEDRLRTALSVFTTTELYSTNIKTTILEWIKQKLTQNTVSEERQKIIIEVLKECICGVTEIPLRPHVAVPIIETLINVENLCTDLFHCFVALLQNIHFVKYFVFNIHQLGKVVTEFINKLKGADVENGVKISGYRVIVHCITRVNNDSFQDHNMKHLFVEDFMEPISLMYEDLKCNLNASDYDLISIQRLFYQILFRDPSFKNAFLRNILASSPTQDSDLDKTAFEIIKKIREFPTFVKPNLLAHSYSLLLSGFLSSRPSNVSTLKFFVALNSFIYVRPVTIDNKNEKCVLLQDNAITVTALTTLILQYNLPTESQWKFTFMSWLSSLIEIIFQKLENGLTSQLLNLLQNLMAFNPALVDENVKKLAKSIMLRQKTGHDVIKAYTNLCLHIVNVSVKLNRMHKLISALLIAIKENLLNYEFENEPDKFGVFPTEVFDCIQTAVTNLPSTVQNVALLNTLFFHLENDCIVILESDSSNEIDARWLLLYDIVCHLISRFIRGTRVVDHSVPEVVKTKFVLLMDSLAVLLGRFGKAIISKKHVPQLSECFLHLCLVWGDMQLLFMIYETKPRKIPKQVGIAAKAPTNLVYVHPYLSDFHWKIIAQRVANFGNDNCVYLLNDLVLQKIHAIPYLEDELQGPYLENVNDDGPSVVCAQYLINHACPKWLFSHVSEFIHLLKPSDVLMLAKNLISYCQQCRKTDIDTIFSADFCESRPLVIAMLCYTFYSLGKKFVPYNLKEMKRMLRRIDYEAMLQAEDQDAEAVETLKETVYEVSSLLSTDFVHATAEIPGDLFKTDLLILNKLPVTFLQRENKSLICLLTLSLLKNLVKLKFVTCNADDILLQTCKILRGVLIDMDIPDFVDCGKLLAWFYHGLKDTPYCDIVMKSICEATKQYGCGVDSVIEIIKAVHDDNRTDVFIESEVEGIDLLTSYLVNFEKVRKRKDEKSEVMGKLKKLCYKNLNELFDPSCEDMERKEKQLALFAILLQEALKSDNSDDLEQLIEKLSYFIEMIEQYDESKSEVFSKFFLILLKYHRKLEEHLPNNFFVHTWGEFFHFLGNDVMSVLLRVASADDYLEMIEILFAHSVGALSEPINENLETLGRVWKVVIDTPVKEVKVSVKKKFIPHLCTLAHEHVISTSSTNCVAKLFLKIFTSFLHNKSIALNYEIIDVCFSLITTITATKSDEVTLLSDCVELLFVFCAVRPKLLLDRIPSFYVCYKSLFVDLVHKCRIEQTNDFEVMTAVAHKMEKLTDALVKHKKYFMKTAISAIGDFLGTMSTVNVVEIVKNHLKNIIYCWIGICDTHGKQHLSSTLPPISRILFQQYSDDYSKYYKFSGKV